jgi:hypothetical protein
MKNARHPRYARHRFPAEVISYAVWLYFRFPLSLRGIVNLSKSELFDRVTPASKPLKVRDPGRPETGTKHAKAVKLTMPLDVCAGEVDYTRTKLPTGNRTALIDQILQPRGLHLVTVEFDNAEEARGFDPLPWFGPEVTADDRFNYQALALRGLSEAPDVSLSNAALDSLLDTLENRFEARTRIAINRPTGKQGSETRAKVATPAQANAQGIKVDLTDIEAAMMREMERTLQKSRT